MLQSGTGARVIERFSLFLDPENASSDLSYQYDLVKTAIYNGGLLGNRNLTAVVPVGESDLIFATDWHNHYFPISDFLHAFIAGMQ